MNEFEFLIVDTYLNIMSRRSVCCEQVMSERCPGIGAPSSKCATTSSKCPSISLARRHLNSNNVAYQTGPLTKMALSEAASLGILHHYNNGVGDHTNMYIKF